MKEGYIALLDSGIGGISLLKELIKIMPNERYLYFGDNDNAPYGNKNLSSLRDITLKNIDYLKQYNIKLLVLACNTLSVNLLEEITTYSGLKTFGVFPPVETSLLSGKPSLLLATERTAENYKEINGLTAVGLKDLAKDVELNAFNLNNISMQKNFRHISGDFVDKPRFYDTVILGCTHYFFVKDKIFDHLKPQKIIFGEYFTAREVKKYLKMTKSLENYKQNQVLFVGKNADFNQKFFILSG